MKLSNIAKIIFTIYLLHRLLPVVGFYTPAAYYLFLLALAVIAVFATMYDDAFVVTFGYLFLLFLPYVLKVVQYAVSSHEKQLIINSSVAFFTESITASLGLILLKTNKSHAAYFFKIITLLLFVTSLSTLIVSILNPNIVRQITADAGSEEYFHYRSMNVGSFEFVYQILLLTPLIIFYYKEETGHKLFMFLVLVYMGFFFWTSQFTTVLFFYIFCLVLLFIKHFTERKAFYLASVCLIAFWVGRSFLASFLYTLSDYISRDNTQSRLLYVAAYLEGSNVSDSLTIHAGRRVELWEKSWDAFLNDPIIGSWDETLVGGHSFCLDTLGLYGLLGLIALFFYFFMSYFFFIRPFSKKAIYPYMLFGFMLSFVLSIINPKVFPIVFTLIYPLAASLSKAPADQVPQCLTDDKSLNNQVMSNPIDSLSKAPPTSA